MDRSKGAVAPHKAVLLLSVLQSIEYREIVSNRIYITPELVARFKDNWHSYVRDERFNPNFSLPFFHLQSDKFWHLRTLPGREILLTSSNSIRSFRSLKDTIDFAYVDDDVFHLFTLQHTRNIIKSMLLQTYLHEPVGPEYSLFDKVESQILNESPVVYKKAAVSGDEEDMFVRSGVFKRVVPRVYNYTCCISGLKITATRDVQMIDACHIIPFSESHDDTIGNGLSLSPSLHRAFDRFLITIDEQYKIIVSDRFTELGNHPIKVFHGQRLMLPHEKKYYPSTENLKWHKERFIELH